jgi:hypothetical protein
MAKAPPQIIAPVNKKTNVKAAAGPLILRHLRYKTSLFNPRKDISVYIIAGKYQAAVQ